MLVGNDFIPHLPHLDIFHGSLNIIMNLYKKMLPLEADYLTNKAIINLDFFERIMHEISASEFQYFQQRGNDEGIRPMSKKQSYREVSCTLIMYFFYFLSCNVFFFAPCTVLLQVKIWMEHH
jgi:5'-3' exonuclease